MSIQQNNNSLCVVIINGSECITIIPTIYEIDLITNQNYKIIGIKKVRKYRQNPTRHVFVFEGPRGGKFRLYPSGSRKKLNQGEFTTVPLNN